MDIRDVGTLAVDETPTCDARVVGSGSAGLTPAAGLAGGPPSVTVPETPAPAGDA